MVVRGSAIEAPRQSSWPFVFYLAASQLQLILLKVISGSNLSYLDLTVFLLSEVDL